MYASYSDTHYHTRGGGQPMYRHHTPTHITTHGEEGNRCIDIILRHTLPHTGRRATDVLTSYSDTHYHTRGGGQPMYASYSDTHYHTRRGGQPMYRRHTPTHGEGGNRCIDIILRHTLPHTGRRATDV